MLNLNCIGKSHIYFKAHRYFKISVHKKPLTIDPPLLKHILSRSATSNQGCGSCWILHGSGSYLIEKTGSDYDHREKNGAGSKPRKQLGYGSFLILTLCITDIKVRIIDILIYCYNFGQ